MWSDSIITNDYIQTQSKYRTRKHFVNLKVGKDEYVIDSELYDKDTRNKGSKKMVQKKRFLKNVILMVFFYIVIYGFL